MRNVAFSVMLIALALLQVAVVTSELSHSNVQSANVAKTEAGMRQVFASSEVVHNASAR